VRAPHGHRWTAADRRGAQKRAAFNSFQILGEIEEDSDEDQVAVEADVEEGLAGVRSTSSCLGEFLERAFSRAVGEGPPPASTVAEASDLGLAAGFGGGFPSTAAGAC
jgi:hypothetical protein